MKPQGRIAMGVAVGRNFEPLPTKPAHEGRVLAVVVNWNKRDLLVECLRSLMAQKTQQTAMCVIDNDSRDDSVTAVQSQFPEVEIMANSKNVGFAGACQQALVMARERGIDWLLVMNNDIVLEDDALRRLINAAESNPKVGLATPQIVFYSRPDSVWWCGGTIDPFSGKTGHLGHRGPRVDGSNPLIDSEYANGCMMLLSKQVLDLPVDFDQRYFAYYEDVDFSIRVREAGLRTVVVTGSVIRHRVSASTGGENSPGFVYFLTRNRLFFVKRNMRAVLFRVVLRGALFEVPREAASFLRGRKAKHFVALVRGFASGILNIPNFKTLSATVR